MQTIGIIGAMEIEVTTLKERMQVEEIVTIASMDFFKGTYHGKNVVIVRSGIGKVNAAICTQILADRFHATAIINTGIAGSLQSSIDIGDIVISSDALQHDMDATGFGYAPGQVPRVDTLAFPADKGLIQLAKDCCGEVNPDIHTFVGRVVSGDQFISDKNKKEWLVNTFAGYCTEMEGAAIAQACYLNGIPFLIVRAISDKADDSASVDYSVFEAKAIEHSVNLLTELIKRYEAVH